MLRTFYFLFITLLIVLICSCGRKEYTEYGIQEIINKTDSLLYTAEFKKFDWGSAKAYSYFRAYYNDAGELIFINEDYRYRSPASVFNRYYFKDGNVLYIISKSEVIKPVKELKNITMFIDPSKNVIAYNKIVNGESVSLDSDEADMFINHAGELRDIVERHRLAKKD